MDGFAAGPDPDAIPVISLQTVDSTNAEARRRAEAGEAGPLWITARDQSEGRGRRGRSWITGEGNLAATLLTTTRRPPAEAAQVSFVAALAVADLVQTYVRPDRVRLKWPNDVLVDQAKVSGILIESGTYGDGRLWLALGIGVNLRHAPADLERPAAAIAAHAEPPDPATALSMLSGRLSVWLRIWRDYGFQPIADAWTHRAAGIGGPCLARFGRETIEGIAEGLDCDGALRLRTMSGEVRRISAGDVFFGEERG